MENSTKNFFFGLLQNIYFNLVLKKKILGFIQNVYSNFAFFKYCASPKQKG